MIPEVMSGHKENLKVCYLSERSPCEKAICKLCWQRQNHGDSKKMGGCQGFEGERWRYGGDVGEQRKDLGQWNYSIPYTEISLCIVQNHRMHTTTSDPSGNHGLWMIMHVSPDLSPVMNAPFWRGKLKMGEVMQVSGPRLYGNSRSLPFDFAVKML